MEGRFRLPGRLLSGQGTGDGFGQGHHNQGARRPRDPHAAGRSARRPGLPSQVPGTRQGHAGVPSGRRARARRRALSSRSVRRARRSASRAMAWFRKLGEFGNALRVLIPLGRRAGLAIEIGPLRLGDPGQVGKAGLGLRPQPGLAESRRLRRVAALRTPCVPARSPRAPPTARRPGATFRRH